MKVDSSLKENKRVSYIFFFYGGNWTCLSLKLYNEILNMFDLTVVQFTAGTTGGWW